MNQKINIVDLGRIDYQTAWDFQKEFHKKVQIGKETDTLFLLEHDPVYTLGKNANKNNLLEQPESEVKVFNVERGGDITYHGPGQLVGYPILDLHHYQKNISWFMRTLEEILIETLSTFLFILFINPVKTFPGPISMNFFTLFIQIMVKD